MFTFQVLCSQSPGATGPVWDSADTEQCYYCRKIESAVNVAFSKCFLFLLELLGFKVSGISLLS